MPTDRSRSALDERIAALTPDKRALLAERLAATRAVSSQSEPPSRSGHRAAPSFGQHRLWFLDQLEGGGPIYNVALSWWIEGRLDVARLRVAVDALLARHESLRTVFVREEDQLWQEVLPALHIDVPVSDVSDAPPDQARATALSRARSFACEPFDLARGPLLRLHLLRTAESTHLLVIVNHHIISDGWSLAVFYRELSALYANPAHVLPNLPIQYAAYAAWQRAELQGERLEAQLAGWRSALSNLPRLDLPLDRLRPPSQSHRGASQPAIFPADLSAALRRLSLDEHVTLYMVLLAAFQVLLARYSGQDDIAVGSPTAGRTRPEHESLIGFFVNTLVLRADLSGNPPFRDFLRQVRETALDAYARQDVPFEKLVEVLHPEHDGSRNPLVQTMFALQNTPGMDFTLPDATVAPQALDTGTAKFDLTVQVFESNDGLRTVWEYATDIFDASTIRRMAQHYRRLLEALAADPALRVGEVPLATSTELQQCLIEWKEPGTPVTTSDRLVHQRFEAHAGRTPDAVAVTCEDRSLTYGELDRLANQLAHHLRAQGVGRESLVGLYLERSIDLIVGVLGILKAGGAYVPVDPRYPPDRVNFILRDSRATVLVTHDAWLSNARAFEGQVVCLDRDGAAIAAHPLGAPSCDADASALAYVIYTSGSTGIPKGVMVTHGNVARLFPATERWLTFGPGDTWTCSHSIAFDFSVWEVWGALVHGARLVVVPYVVARDPEAFHALLHRERVTVLSQTPSAFHQLSAADADLGAVRPLALRLVIFGGEALDAQALRGWFDRHGDTRPEIFNLYGITETTVHVTCRLMRRSDLDAPGGSRIGSPLSDLRVYLLDERLQPVPIGVPGEIVVGGAGVARGYLERPDLTARRFVVDPFSSTPGARMYRSGDRARRRPDGDLEFLGRLDDQVKIRGFRIEPGEIEAVLTEHPVVAQAIVVVREDTPGDRRLVAYVVTTAAPLDGDDLRAFVRGRLPEYMRPSAYVALERLPLTANGKVDRKALPEPGRGGDTVRAFTAPIGPTEALIAGMWTDLLKLDRVSRDAHFFELGGHSLLAVSLLDRMRRAGMNVDVRTLFLTPTLAELASAVDGAGPNASDVEVPPNRIPRDCDTITPEMLPLVDLSADDIATIAATVDGGARNIQDIYPLAPLQEGILFHYALALEADPYLLSFLVAFDSKDRLNQYLAALQAVIDRHDILRTSVVREGLPEPVQVVWRYAPLGVDEIDLAAADDAVTGLLARFNARTFRLDVHRAPLIHAVVAHDAARGRWLLLQLEQHLAIDHTTQALMQEEIAAHLAGMAAQLPSPVPFRDFVARARFRVSRDQHTAFFRHLLGDVTEPTTPFGLTDAYGDGTGLAHSFRSIEPSLVARLRARARALGVSTAALCHVAWAQVVARTSGRNDVVFGTLLFGRMHGGSGTDRALGLFINTLPIRIAVGEDGAEETVRRTHGLLAQMLRHEHAPLVLAQRCSRVPAPAPLFSSLLNYRHRMTGVPFAHKVTRLVSPGAELLHIDSRTSYPLTLSVDDDGERLALSVSVLSPIEPGSICTLMTTAIERLVTALEDAPATALGTLDVLPESERRRLVLEWNDTATEYSGERSIHCAFEEQVARTPDAIAVVSNGRSVTYHELNTRANQLARYLQSRGVVPGAIVALLLDRGIDLVAALLGVLKAGGAYLPLEPDQPVERACRILTDASALVVVTERRLLDARLQTSAQIVCLDECAAEIAEASGKNPVGGATGDWLAYVLYTSGSTGVPKGIAVPHRAVARLVVNTNYVTFGPSDVVAQASNCSFDAATFEIWGALLHGARLVVIEKDVILSPRLLEHTLQEHGITVIFLTAALFSRIAAERPSAFGSVRHLIVGGDVLDTAAVRRVFDAAPPTTLSNGYGPTETTTFATTFQVTPLDADAASVPIGRPIANTTVYVLDTLGRPCPVGVPGEIHVGGPGVAAGYVNNPSATGQKFIPDPFSSRDGARLYRTGDLGRYRPDGNIEFLGRTDGMVKLRGFRIEPGEIEAALRQHPHVSEAAVVVRQDGSGDKRLVAYVVTDGLAGSLTSELRRFLARTLPHYMVPAAFVRLERLPLNQNGKIDREALPAAPGSRPDLAVPFDSAVTDLERTVIGIWEKVLGTRSIGISDNFFDLGGNSLSALTLVDRIERECHASLPPAALFEAPTVAQLAQLLSVKVPPPPGASLVAIQPQGARPPLFCVHGGGGHVVGYADLARHLGTDQPVYGLQAVGLDGQRTPHTDLKEMAAEYVREITRLRPEGPYHLTGLSFGGLVAFEMACQLSEQARRVGLLAILDSGRPGHLEVTRDERVEHYARRLRYHATNIALGPNRFQYVRRKSAALLRLVRNRLAALASKPFTTPGETLAPPLRRVADANWRAAQSYTPRQYRGKLTLFVARERAMTVHRLLDLGWGPFALGGVETYEVDGDHSNLVNEPHVRDLATHLRRCLAKANT